MPERKRIAIVGAGLSGLGAMKASVEEDFEPVCFEKTGYIGGLWRYHDDDTNGIASVMKTTIINNSKEIGAISNYPPPAEYPNFMHNSLMYQYIKSVAEKLGAEKYIHFFHEVLKVEKADDYEVTGKWKVTCLNTQNGEKFTDVYDCVAVCIGHHVYPNIPEFPGQEKFNGKIMHSHSLKNTKGFEDLRIVVVGVGNSGVDAAAVLSTVAKQVYLSTRRGGWILPKVGPFGWPIDSFYITRSFFLALRYLPFNLMCSMFEKIMNTHVDHELYNLKPKHRILSQHPTVCDILPIKLLSGTVRIRGNIKKFTKNGVIFDGEKQETPVDVVILATGYQIKFSFLDDEILPVSDNRVKLYKYVFPPQLPHPSLAILGLIQPRGPGIPPGEMQSRWALRVMSGKLSLPSEEQMYKDIKKKEDFNRKRYVDSPRHTLQVEFIEYQDELAEEIGVKPNLLKLAFTDPKLFWALFFGPSLPYQYRLQGPHAWQGARDAILTYKERVKTPLLKPGPKHAKRQKSILSHVTRITLFLFVIWYFFLAIVVADF